MCGIVGFNWDDAHLVRKMADKISHRGPDEGAYYTDNFMSLGQRRLKIIDLTPNIYPIHNEDHSVQLVFNGEIFNYKELREELINKGHEFYTDCDAEVIVHMYEESEHNHDYFMNALNGQFAFALWDTNKKFLYLVRDRLSIKPLYYAEYDGRFLFASEAKALLEYIPPELDKDVVQYYKHMNTVPAPFSLFKHIHKVRAGSFVLFDGEDLGFRDYWNFTWDCNEKAKKDELKSVLSKAVESQMVSDVPLGAYLSGGIDSSTVVALMSQFTDNLKTFSVGFDCPEVENELEYARPVAEMFNTDHHEIVVKEDSIDKLKEIIYHLDEPVANPTIIPIYFLSKEAKKHITVALSGTGGDELFAGYRQHVWMNILHSVRFVNYLKPFFRPFYHSGNRYIRFGAKFLSNANKLEKAYNELVFGGRKSDIFDHYRLFNGNTSVLNQVTEAEMKLTLSNEYLFFEDKVNMANAVEARVPMLDNDTVNYVLSLPDNQRLKLFKTKYMLRKTMRDVLPDRVINRPKCGFTAPLTTWYKTAMKPMLSELKPDSQYLGNDSTENINKAFQELVFELWKEVFLV